MGQKLAGKVALVTGASKGIGAGIAIELANEGASVVVNYSSSKEAAEKVVQTITKNGGKAAAIQGNVSQESDVKKLIADTVQKYGQIDILVNNAGVYEFVPLENITRAHFQKIFEINVLGLLLVTQEAVKHMQQGGSIINISSLASTSGIAGASVYGATKASVDVITKSLAKELGVRQIRVNAINPGMVVTEGVSDAGFLESDLRKHFESEAPLHRIGEPKDIAPAAVFLASQDSSWMTGETLVISGGMR